jgi:transcriptional regulator, propionate catabolism operon regulatory protein
VARGLRAAGSRLSAQALLAPLAPRLAGYAWPGNVRELENVCERIVMAVAPAAQIGPGIDRMVQADCPELFAPASAPRAEADPRHLAQVLHECGGNRQRAAQRLGISRSTLWRRMRQQAQDDAPPG